MVKIHCLGGFREVGRNAVLIEGKTEKILFEYGFKIDGNLSPLPLNIKPDAMFLTHGHLDHLGSIPILYKKWNFPIYGTAPTKDDAEMLLKDSLEIARINKTPREFTSGHVTKMMGNWRSVRYNQKIKVGNSTVEVYDAGHIAGSAMYVLNMDGKRILYTGDFKLDATRMVDGAKIDVGKIDIVLMETTYSARAQTPRDKTEKQLKDIIDQTILKNGIVLLPSFALRAPEILLALNQSNVRVPIYLDGMAKAATDIVLRHPQFLRNSLALKKIMVKVRKIQRHEERTRILDKPCVIVTTGGTLDGGPIVHYLKQLYARKDCALILTGFQFPKSAGSYLVETGRYVTEEFDLKLGMPLHKLSFSGHADRNELLRFVQKIRPKQVVCMHGDQCQRFATELKGRFNIEGIAPKPGEVLTL